MANHKKNRQIKFSPIIKPIVRHTIHARIFIYDTRTSEAVLLMVLYDYFKKGRPVLPTLRTCGEQANTEALGESSREPTGKKAVTPRGKYIEYLHAERARVGKYAAENGSTKVARYFLKLLDRRITESSARRLTYVFAFASAKAQLLRHKLTTVKIAKFKFRQY